MEHYTNLLRLAAPRYPRLIRCISEQVESLMVSFRVRSTTCESTIARSRRRKSSSSTIWAGDRCMEKKTQLSTVHAPAIVHHFDKDMIPFEVYREDDSHLARAHAVAVHPLSGSFSQIHGHNFTHKLLDRPTNRFNGERVGQMSMSEEFFGLLREEE